MLIELGGRDVYFLISFKLDRLDVGEGMKPCEVCWLDVPSCVWKTLRLLARAKSLRRQRLELLRLWGVVAAPDPPPLPFVIWWYEDDAAELGPSMCDEGPGNKE